MKILAVKSNNYFLSSLIQHISFCDIEIYEWDTKKRSTFDALDENKPSICIYTNEQEKNIRIARAEFPDCIFVLFTNKECEDTVADYVISNIENIKNAHYIGCGADVISYLQSKSIDLPESIYRTKLAAVVLEPNKTLREIEDVRFNIPHRLYGNVSSVNSCGVVSRDLFFLAINRAEYTIIIGDDKYKSMEFYNAILSGSTLLTNKHSKYGIFYSEISDIKSIILTGQTDHLSISDIKKNHTMLNRAASFFNIIGFKKYENICLSKIEEVNS